LLCKTLAPSLWSRSVSWCLEVVYTTETEISVGLSVSVDWEGLSFTLYDIHYTMCLQAENNEYERADRLMNILERRRDSLLTQFYCALEATDQHDLVLLIKYKGTTLVKYKMLSYCRETALQGAL